MFLTAIEYIETNKVPYIVLFNRNGKQREKLVISGFKPYFFVKKSSGVTNLKSIDGEFVERIFTNTPEDVLQERKMYDKTYESDVRFTTRYLIDCVPKIEKSNLRVQYTDIEMDPATNQIISIAVYDNYLQKCVVFVWREDLSLTQYDKTFSFPSGYSFKATIHTYNSKTKMLDAYIRFVQNTDCDILTGWYSTSFDFKHIIQQINSAGLRASDLSPLHKAYVIGEKINKLEGNIKISGRILWDMLKAYASLQPARLPDYSLEAVAQKELGEGKHKRTMSFTELWKKSIDELIEYNCKDSILVLRIDKKRKLLEYYDELRRFVGCEFHSLWFETLLWDVYILRKLHGIMVLPTKQKITIPPYKGARIFQPAVKGIHNNILLIDLQRLYPSIIITYNMSPETLVVGEPHDPTKHYILPNGVAFKKEPIGLLPKILLELVETREKLQAKMKEYPYGSDEYETYYNQQFTAKILMNALYGAMGYFNFRLATPEIASSVTFVGRNILDFVRSKLEELGYKILAGHTDSIFYFGRTSTPLRLVEEMSNNVDYINNILDKFVKDFAGGTINYIKIEPKKIYESLIISEKKTEKQKHLTAKSRYAGLLVWVEGEYINPKSEKALDIVGYEQKRSDSSEFSRDLQKKILRSLLTGKSEQDLKVYIQESINSISNNSLEYLGIPSGLGQKLESYKVDNPHRRGSFYSNKYLGTSFNLGDKPKLVYISRTGKYPKTDVICFNRDEDVPIDFELDVKTMIEKCVIATLEHLLDAAGINIEDLLYGSSKLEEWF